MTQPVGFVAHGAPTLATDTVKGAELAAWVAGWERPRGVLVISAHWEAAPLALSSLGAPETIHDFGGFADELYALRYPSPPAAALGERVAGLFETAPTATQRGLDHGVWVPLLHMLPAADVPVLQLSMPHDLSPSALLELGRRLRPLREEGVWLLGSGNLVHNLRRLDWSGAGPPPSWASEFDAWLREALLARDVDALLDARARAPGYALAHPSDEHLRPLFPLLGAADLAREPLAFPVEGWEYGSLSRRCVQLG